MSAQLRTAVLKAVNAAGSTAGVPSSVAGCDGAKAAAAMKVWRQLAALPNITKGELHGRRGELATLAAEVCDFDTLSRSAMTKTFSTKEMSADKDPFASVPFLPAPSPDLGTLSPSRTQRIRFSNAEKNAKAGGNGEWRVEVLRNTTRVLCVAAGDVHGAPAPGVEMQHVAWSPDESKVIYVAEKLRKKTDPFWKTKGKKAAGDAENAGAASTRGACEHTQSWGEGYPSFSTFALFVLDIAAETTYQLELSELFDDMSCVMPEWVDNSSFVFTVYAHFPRRLGIAACTTRPNHLFLGRLPEDGPNDDGKLTVSCSSIPLPSSHLVNARSLTRCPFHGPNEDAPIAFLASTDSKAHSSSFALCLITFPLGKPSVRQITDPFDSSPDCHGFYLSTGRDVHWLAKGTVMVVSPFESSKVFFSVNLSTRGVRRLATGDLHTFGTWKYLDNIGTAVLATKCTAVSPPQVVFCEDILAEGGPAWTCVFDTASALPDGVRDAAAAHLTTSIYNVPDAGPTQIIVSGALSKTAPHAKDAPKSPLVLFVHGGPNSVDGNVFMLDMYFLMLLGFNVCSVNYQGSTGFGQDNVDALLGKIGTLDVQHTMKGLDHALSLFGDALDPAKVCVAGGSHGGFLSAHVSGQCPDRFKAVAMRNPVINLPSMADVTDIPDWVYYQGGSVSDYNTLAANSPFRYAANVTAATLIGIGQQDLRVPPSQGKSWFYALREKSPKCEARLMEYEDVGHPLNTVEAETDFALHKYLLFARVCDE